MKTNSTTGAARVGRWIAIAALLAIGASGELRAQFQTVFGSPSREAAQGGIIQTADGNFIAVGYSYSFTPDEDVYVVESDICGNLVWARSYDLGGADAGRKIRQLADGSFIIVGSSFRAGECASSSDAFLLKLDAVGNVEWASVYGGPRDDEGLDVIAVPDGMGQTTFTVAGRSNSYGRGDYDAWLFRTDAIGSLIWGSVYGETADDGFTTLDINCDGDIIAAGSSQSYTRSGDADIFVVWASQGGGTFQHASTYGRGGDEGAGSIVPSGSSFYLAGYTTSLGSGTEGYVMRAGCSSGIVTADRVYGGYGTLGNDRFTELRMLPAGNLILTGFMEDAFGGFGDADVWLTELTPQLNRLWSGLYGGAGADQGWSVAVADPGALSYRIIQAGLTSSYGFGGVGLYEVLTDSAGGVGCNLSEPWVQESVPGFTPRDVSVTSNRAGAQCYVLANATLNEVYEILCSPCFRPSKSGEESLSGAIGAARVPAVARPVMVR